jgi:hypothetical protein
MVSAPALLELGTGASYVEIAAPVEDAGCVYAMTGVVRSRGGDDIDRCTSPVGGAQALRSRTRLREIANCLAYSRGLMT